MEPSAAPDLWYSVIKSYGMLFVVIGIMAGFLYLLKRFTGLKYQGGGKDPIKVLGSHYIAPKTRLIIVDILGEKMLLGVTPGSINLISKIPDSPGLPESDETQEKSGLFRKILTGNLKKETAGDCDHV